MSAVQLYCWHFMPYPYLPDDFDDRYESGWVTVPNALWDHQQGAGVYGEYIDQLAYADELGFDGVVLNEHHQNIYGLMPSPNIIAAALTQRVKRGRIVVLGNLLPLHGNPLRVAEEYAMLDNMSGGRLIAGFAVGGGPEFFNYDVPAPQSRDQFWEALDLILRAWTEDGPFAHEGRYYPLRYVNPWPRPLQIPHPPVWVPGALSLETMERVAARGFGFFLSSRLHWSVTQQAMRRFSRVLEDHGQKYQPYRMGALLSVYVAETDEQARAECEEGVWYFLRNCLKGHLRTKGRMLTFGPGTPSMTYRSWEAYLKNANRAAPMLGDAKDWEELDQIGSIMVGSPETVYRKLSEIIRECEIGHILLQFHIGNLSDTLTRKSMRIFAEQVAPRLREESTALFGQRYPELQRAG